MGIGIGLGIGVAGGLIGGAIKARTCMLKKLLGGMLCGKEGGGQCCKGTCPPKCCVGNASKCCDRAASFGFGFSMKFG